MRVLIRMLAAAVALGMSTGTALAAMGKTNTDVALRTAPTAHAELILNLSEGTLVNCRPLLAWLVRCHLEQIWWLCPGERTSIADHSGSWSTGNPRLSPISL